MIDNIYTHKPKKKKSTKGSLSYFSSLNPNAGDVEKSIQVFNKGVGETNLGTAAMMEEIGIDESVDDANIITIGDLIEGSSGNMDDSELDSELRLFSKIARKLGVKNADDVVVLVDQDERYDPDYYIFTEEGDTVTNLNRTGTIKDYVINNIHFIREKRNGISFMYFFDDQNLEAYISFTEDGEEVEESFDIRESLNKFDVNGFYNNNYYDLVAVYESLEPKLTPQDKEEIKKVIQVSDDPETISAVLSKKLDKDLHEDYSTEYYENKLKDAITDFIDYMSIMELPIPEDLIYSSWGDWRDSLEMGMSETLEDSEAALNLLRPYYRQSKREIDQGIDNPGAEDEIEMYEKIKKYHDMYINMIEGNQYEN